MKAADLIAKLNLYHPDDVVQVAVDDFLTDDFELNRLVLNIQDVEMENGKVMLVGGVSSPDLALSVAVDFENQL